MLSNHQGVARFVVGTLIEEIATAVTWEEIARAANALHNVRRVSQMTMAQEQIYQQRAATPPQAISQQPSGPLFRTAPMPQQSMPSYTDEPMHPGEVDPDYDSIPWGQ